MKKTIALFVFSVALANAGIIKVATFPVRHPVKTAKPFLTGARKVLHVAAKVLF